MSMKKQTKAPPKKDSKKLNVYLEIGKSEERKIAEVALSPTTMNAITAQAYIKPTAGEIDLNEAVLIMRENAKKINNSDLSEIEATLAAQVVSLNSIFNTLAMRSANNMGEYLKAMEIYLRLALKAQAQCTRTAEVLATIKNPPVVFAKQANIAHGHQQVNNNNQPTHAGKTNSPNELLKEANHATLDIRRTAETSRVNQDMATVEIFNGSKDCDR